MKRWFFHLPLLAALLAADLPDRLGIVLGLATGEPVGGAAYICALLGIAAGLSFASGNLGGLLASMAAADAAGCF